MSCRFLDYPSHSLRVATKSKPGPRWRQSIHTFSPIQTLPDWDVSTFQCRAFNAEIPAVLPACQSQRLPATDLWFEAESSSPWPGKRLREDTLGPHGSSMVSLELTSTSDATPQTASTTFTRFQAPLSLFLSWTAAQQASNPSDPSLPSSTQRLYLAQHPLSSLPAALLTHLPTPSLVSTAGRGDVYASNLWLGLAPTYTPLHRDPNPNLLVQVCGGKRVRMFEPDVGRAVWEGVRMEVGKIGGERGGGGSAAFRGEEMMQGVEREVLEKEVWGKGMGNGKENSRGLEAEIQEGQALFIPKGWWHSIKGVGDGVVGSVNWWFR